MPVRARAQRPAARSRRDGVLVRGVGFPQSLMKNLGGSMNWKRFFVVVVALLAAFSLSTWRTAAQTSTTGDVAGVVTDPTNAVVPDAKVTLKDNAKGSSQESKTNK